MDSVEVVTVVVQVTNSALFSCAVFVRVLYICSQRRQRLLCVLAGGFEHVDFLRVSVFFASSPQMLEQRRKQTLGDGVELAVVAWVATTLAVRHLVPELLLDCECIPWIVVPGRFCAP